MNTANTMKAVTYTQYGSPDVLQFTNIAKPVPQDNEILIKIHTATVGAVDSIVRTGENMSARLYFGLLKPKQGVRGGLFSGVVEAVGQHVTLYQVGDEVFGSAMGGTTHAGYISVAEDGLISLKPEQLSHIEAVGIPEAMTALYFLRDLAKTKAGDKVLINGASGAIGTFAVQLAKYYGAIVTAVCSTANVDLVKSLGADQVIDYTREDFTEAYEVYDTIFDVVNQSSFSKSKGALKRGGGYYTTAAGLGILFQTFWTSKVGDKRAMVGFAGLNQHKRDLDFLTELADNGTLIPIVDRCYPFDQIQDAHRYVDTGRKKGHVVLTIA